MTAQERKTETAAAVQELLRLKDEYKATTGNEYVPASTKTPPAPPPAAAAAAAAAATATATGVVKKTKEDKKKGDTDTKKEKKNAISIEKVVPAVPVYVPSANLMDNLKCIYTSKVLDKPLPEQAPDDFDFILVPETPAIVDCTTGMLVFSSNVICKYLNLDQKLPPKLQDFLHVDEFELMPALHSLLISKAPLAQGN